MLCISAAIADMRCMSVCLSRSSIMSKRINISSKFFSPSGSHTILVFPHQTGWRYSDGNHPNGGVECRLGIGTSRDSGLIAGYRRLLDVRSAKNSYRRPCSVSHSRRRTIECLFVTACSMDQYAEEKRTEKNLIVPIGISEAETTNDKRLALDVLYWRYTDTKHRAASLRQQSLLSVSVSVSLSAVLMGSESAATPLISSTATFTNSGHNSEFSIQATPARLCQRPWV